MSMSVCRRLSVCLYAWISHKPHVETCIKFSVRVACGRGLVLIWRRCNTRTLCILPALWMSSYFSVMGRPMAQVTQSKHRGKYGTDLTPRRIHSNWLTTGQCSKTDRGLNRRLWLQVVLPGWGFNPRCWPLLVVRSEGWWKPSQFLLYCTINYKSL